MIRPRAVRFFGFVLGLVVRAWLGTLRLTLLLDPALAGAMHQPWCLAFWHGQQFGLLRWELRRPTVALVSLSRDGELLAAAFRPLGVLVARGSSSRGGASGLRAIVRRLRKGGVDAAFAVDGPRGPGQVVHEAAGGVGAALAARLAGGVVVPMAAACGRAHRFARAWDRFELPLPFSRVAVAVGAPLPPGEATADGVGRAIEAARGVAARALGG